MNSIRSFRKAVRVAVAVLVGAGLAQGGLAHADVVASAGWVDAAPGSATAMGYLVLTNQGGEEAKLLRIVSPLCDRVMINRASVDSDGKARLWPVGFLKIAPGEAVRFEPKGLLVKFDELNAPFAAGQKVPLQITFEGQAEFTVMLEVRAVPAAAASAGEGAGRR